MVGFAEPDALQAAGADTAEILAELGYDSSAIADLMEPR